ncbi:MAG: response regulator [Pseudomonadota bacterium]
MSEITTIYKPLTSLPCILFLDDEERILRTLRYLFQSKYEVITTSDPMVAITHMRQRHIHVVVSDQAMPTMTGIEFLRKAKEVSPTTTRILLTGYPDLNALMDSINEGEVFRFINKPWNREEIQRVLAEAVIIGEKLANGLIVPSANIVPGQKLSQMILTVSKFKRLYTEVAGLEKDICSVLHASTLEKAEAILRLEKITVVVVELEPGNEEILVFLKSLKKSRPGIVTIIFTPNTDTDAVMSLVDQAHPFRFLTMPASTAVLKSSIDAALQYSESLHPH